jgi:hypothetical protein
VPPDADDAAAAAPRHAGNLNMNPGIETTRSGNRNTNERTDSSDDIATIDTLLKREVNESVART